MADAVPTEEQSWSLSTVPECGPSLPGTAGVAMCPACPGGTACYGGRCEDQCTIAEVTEVGQCSANVAKWCEDGAPREVDCAQEGSYCCTAGAPGNQIGQATCCSCALECELKGWECGMNSCGARCGLPESDDGCAAGYDCQGRTCVCQIPELCGGAEVKSDADVGMATDVNEADVVEGVSGSQDTTRSGGCGECSGGGAAPPLAFVVALLLWLHQRRRRVQAHAAP